MSTDPPPPPSAPDWPNYIKWHNDVADIIRAGTPDGVTLLWGYLADQIIERLRSQGWVSPLDPVSRVTITEEMVERGARAICAVYGGNAWGAWKRASRACLTAALSQDAKPEPGVTVTEAMVERALDRYNRVTSGARIGDPVPMRAALEAALNSPQVEVTGSLADAINQTKADLANW